MFPSNESITWHPLPSPGSSREKFPCFSGTMECTDVLRPSRRASLPSLGATRCCACGFAPCGPGRPTAGPGFVHRSLLPVHGIGRRSGPPRFLGNPCVPTPCSPTPAGPTRQAIRRSRRGPRSDKNEDSHHEDFGAQSHGLGTRCLRFVPSIAARGRKTRFPLLATLRDGLGYPQDSDERFRVASYISSPFPRLSWRKVSAFLETRRRERTGALPRSVSSTSCVMNHSGNCQAVIPVFGAVGSSLSGGGAKSCMRSSGGSKQCLSLSTNRGSWTSSPRWSQ